MTRRMARYPIRGLAFRRLLGATALSLYLLGVVSCGGSSGQPGGGPLPGSPPPTSATLDVLVANVLSEPIAGATVTVDAGGSSRQETSDARGAASFTNLPPGPITLRINADGFESQSWPTDLASGTHSWELRLDAVGAWAVGRALILGTDVVERAEDGSNLTFSVDVAVIAGENGEPLEALTEADFRIYTIDCGWGGPRDCASDAAGNAIAGSGAYSTDGVTRAFEFRPAAARRAYLVGVLAERSGEGNEWDLKGPALKSFFSALSGNDAIGLASVHLEDEMATLTVHGPFSLDGNAFADAIDGLGSQAGDPPPMQPSLLDSIEWTAAAMHEFPERDATLLVLSTPYLSIGEINDATALARQSGVRISTVTGWNHGLPEIAVRTGGFVAPIDDMRQFATVFGAMDRVLGAALPSYRMQFRLSGAPGIFVRGGNVKTRMHIDVPAPVVNRGAQVEFDIAIP